MKNKTKYLVAAGIGACLCVGLGFAMGASSAKNSSKTQEGYVLNQETVQKDEFVQDEFSVKESGSKEISNDMIEKIQEGFSKLSEEEQKAILEIFNLQNEDVSSLDQQKIESLIENAKDLSEEEQKQLHEIFSSFMHADGQNQELMKGSKEMKDFSSKDSSSSANQKGKKAEKEGTDTDSSATL